MIAALNQFTETVFRAGLTLAVVGAVVVFVYLLARNAMGSR